MASAATAGTTNSEEDEDEEQVSNEEEDDDDDDDDDYPHYLPPLVDEETGMIIILESFPHDSLQEDNARRQRVPPPSSSSSTLNNNDNDVECPLTGFHSTSSSLRSIIYLPTITNNTSSNHQLLSNFHTQYDTWVTYNNKLIIIEQYNSMLLVTTADEDDNNNNKMMGTNEDDTILSNHQRREYITLVEYVRELMFIQDDTLNNPQQQPRMEEKVTEEDITSMDPLEVQTRSNSLNEVIENTDDNEATTTTTTTTTTTKMSNELQLPSLQQLDKAEDVSSLSTTHMSMMSLEDISNSLFQVGMKFIGKIYIPGTVSQVNSNSSSEYELIIIQHARDLMNNDCILAVHGAYSDKQAVHIQLTIGDAVADVDDKININKYKTDHDSDSKATTTTTTTQQRVLKVEYSDGETVCRGVFNQTYCRFEGCVHQRKQVNDGIFYSSDSSTHVFTLYPCTAHFPRGREGMDTNTELLHIQQQQRWADRAAGTVVVVDGTTTAVAAATTATTTNLSSFILQDLLSSDTRAIAKHRHRTQLAKNEVLNCYNRLYQEVVVNSIITDDDIQKLKQHYQTVGSDIDDLTIEQQTLLQLQYCNWESMYNETIILGEYICAEYRRQAVLLNNLVFSTFENRTTCMNLWKSAKMALADAHTRWDEWLAHARHVTMGIYLYGGNSSSNNNNYYMSSTYHRLAINYECLESAFRRASVRLPENNLTRYEIIDTHQLVEEDQTCIICQSPLLDVNNYNNKYEKKARATTEVVYYKLPCAHVFHEVCVKKWLHDHSSCPVCRYSLS